MIPAKEKDVVLLLFLLRTFARIGKRKGDVLMTNESSALDGNHHGEQRAPRPSHTSKHLVSMLQRSVYTFSESAVYFGRSFWACLML